MYVLHFPILLSQRLGLYVLIVECKEEEDVRSEFKSPSPAFGGRETQSNELKECKLGTVGRKFGLPKTEKKLAKQRKLNLHRGMESKISQQWRNLKAVPGRNRKHKKEVLREGSRRERRKKRKSRADQVQLEGNFKPKVQVEE
ncbi:hypothetical protein RUM43_000265 [Polyplax serrata]|uniref:Uncharacterized protein n=1 Tax=Polyplax serrata TaxID=468196 RepID=A0AAN8SGR3_POLSC